ncbi:MAG: zinc ribbon domain-containing protein [Phycisphaerales bacterium]|nr:zinc ribbon domain-containing protein [Phycisphaerales bacterium]
MGISLVFLVLPLLAIGLVAGCVLIVMGLIGRPHFDDPRCAGCGYDLRTFGERPATCPECGASLDRRGAVRFAGKRRSPRFIWVGSALIVVVLVVVVGGVLAARFAVARQMAAANSSQVFNTRGPALGALLQADPSDGLFWFEIDSRLKAGTLTAEEATSIVTALAAIAEAERGAPGVHGPSLPFALMQSGDQLDQMIRQGLLGAESLDVLARMLSDVKTPAIPTKAIVREPLQIDFWSLSTNQPPIDSLRTVVLPRELRIDGKVEWTPATAEKDSRGRSGWQRLNVQAPSLLLGVHELELDVERLVVRTDGSVVLPPDGESLVRLANERPGELPIVAHATETIRASVEAVGADDPVIKAIVDPALAPAVRKGVTVRRARLLRVLDASQAQLEIELALDPPDGVPIIGQVTATLDGKELVGGMFSVVRSGNATSQSNVPLIQALIEPPSADVTTVRIRVRPLLAGRDALRSGIEHAWGRTIDLGDVPLERRDGDG